MSKIIFKTLVGSHLFGTTTSSSDVDIKGVFIPTAREILMPITPEHISLSTGNDKSKNTSSDTDEEYYALHKFLNMIGKGDMVATEMLFAKDDSLKIHSDDRYLIWNMVFENRHRLLSRECKGFVGYVQRQANTYSLRGERLNEVNAIIRFLKKMQINYPEAKKLQDVPYFRALVMNGICNPHKVYIKHTSYELITVNGSKVFHLICCDRKVPDSAGFKHAIEVYQNVADEYGHRARAAAANEGRDWKAISHAVRVGEEAVELLSTEKLTFPRPNAQELLDIKLGNVEYSKVSDRLEELLSSVEDLVKSSPLPEKPDYQWIEEFYLSVYSDTVKKSNI